MGVRWCISDVNKGPLTCECGGGGIHQHKTLLTSDNLYCCCPYDKIQKTIFVNTKCMELLHTFVCASIWCLSQFSFLLSLNGNLRKGLKFFFFLFFLQAKQLHKQWPCITLDISGVRENGLGWRCWCCCSLGSEFLIQESKKTTRLLQSYEPIPGQFCGLQHYDFCNHDSVPAVTFPHVCDNPSNNIRPSTV